MTDEISTNCVTSIRRVLERFTVGPAPNQATDSWQVWADLLDLSPVNDHPSRASVARWASVLVLPIPARARFQVGTTYQSMSAALDDAEMYLQMSVVGGLANPQQRESLKILTSSTSALTTAEEIVDVKWGTLPKTALDDIERSVDDVRESVGTLVEQGVIDPLLMPPLHDALDWTYKAIALSRKLGCLYGVGAMLHQTSRAGTEILVTTAGDQAVDPGGQGDTFGDVVEALTALEFFAALLVVAGRLDPSALLLLPATKGFTSVIRMSGREQVFENLRRRVLEWQARPEISAGDTTEESETPPEG